MVEHVVGTGSRRWPLRGFWRAWYWISWLIGLGCVLGWLALAVAFSLFTGQSPAIPLALGAPLPIVGAVIAWQLATTATTVIVDADGTLVVRRGKGTLRTHATRVTRVRKSALISEPNTPIVIESADGSVQLVRKRSEIDEIVGAIREHHRGVKVEI